MHKHTARRLQLSPRGAQGCGQKSPTTAHQAAVISSPDLGVLAVAAAGVLCAFWSAGTRYLNTVSAANPVQIPLSLILFELNGYDANAVQLHVSAAEVLARCGIDGEDFR
jgi:hypothetical protein